MTQTDLAALRAKVEAEINQHVGWLYQYVLCMNEQNWRDMQTNLERQLDRLKAALSAPAAEQQSKGDGR